MLRITLTERGRTPLPTLDLDDTETGEIVIGSGRDARIRLPAQAVAARHIEIAGGDWIAHAAVSVDGVARGPGDRGALGAGVVFELGDYRIAVAPAPRGTLPSPPQRTQSLARELVRGLLGDDAAPRLELETGAGAGAVRVLPPPEARLVIGRGDEADWRILDEDLSREHLEIRRSWDAVSARDLGSKNGTLVDGAVLTTEVELRDGALLALGRVVLRFRDPAERHLLGPPSEPHLRARSRPLPVATPPGAAAAAPARPAAAAGPRWAFPLAVALAALATAALVWLLAT